MEQIPDIIDGIAEQDPQLAQDGDNDRHVERGNNGILTLEQQLATYRNEHIEKMATLSAESSTCFVPSDFIALSIHPELREAFVVAFIERNVETLTLDLDGIHVFHDIAERLPDRNAVWCGLHELLRSLDRLPLLELRFEDGLSTNISWVGLFISSCPQIQTFVLYFNGCEMFPLIENGRHFPLPLTMETWRFGDKVQAVHLFDVTLPTLHSFLPVLSRTPQQVDMLVRGANGQDLSPLLIRSLADAEVLRQIISLTGLRKLTLDNVTLESSAASAIICECIALSGINDCVLSDVIFAEGSAAMVVDALVKAPLICLTYCMPRSAAFNFYEPIWVGLRQSPTLKEIYFGKFDEEFLDCVELLGWLGDGQPWKCLERLFLSVRNWNADFEKRMIEFAQHLQTIVFSFPADFNGPSRAPEGFLTAADSGSRCLEHLHVVQRQESIDPDLVVKEITESWCVDLQPILDLNQLRRILADVFGGIEKAAVASDKKLLRKLLVVVFEVLSVPHLYGFLRRNELHLQQLIKDLGRDVDAAVDATKTYDGDVAALMPSDATPARKKRRID